MRRTKIVCTIGPATESEDNLAKLIDAGMNVARLNFSHGTHESHGQIIGRLRRIAETKDRHIAILQDLSGPKIRTGIVDNPITLQAGRQFTLCAKPVASSPGCVAVSYDRLAQEVESGDQILLADGAMELKVAQVKGADIICEVIDGGILTSHKGINLPGRTLSLNALTEKDRADLKFGLSQNVDYIAMSFVRTREDIQDAIEVIERKKQQVPIIAKIEKHEALDNIDDIIETADGIMVARGDLAVEIPLERVPIYQKELIHKANLAQKPVITATQMLKSMVDNSRPTRAEANDVANAMVDGTDAVMLSEETTIGQYPVEAVRTMAKILHTAETSNVVRWRRALEEKLASRSISNAVCNAASVMARELNAAAIITPTQSGSTARAVSSHRPEQPILALSPDPAVARRLGLIWGVYPMEIEGYFNSDEMMERAKDKALKTGLVNFGDVVIITAGFPIGVSGTTNLIKAEVLY